ncbi:MAG: hypothetical protein IPH13_20630 [Planctomycetes bacterium]|nr:hypothetical protein [Planctomycetota bacterium]
MLRTRLRSLLPPFALLPVFALVPLLAPALAVAAPADPVAVSVRPKVGSIVRFRTTLAQEQINETRGIEVVTAWATTQSLSLRVLGRGDDDVSQAELTFDRIRGRMQLAAEQEVAFDSSLPIEPHENATIAAVVRLKTVMAGKAFPMHLSPMGKVSDVERFAAVMKTSIEEARAAAPELGALLDESVALATDEHAASVFQGLFAPLPTRGLEIGDTFASDAPMHVCLGGHSCIPFEQRLTLTAADDDTVTFAAEGKLGDELRTALETGVNDLRLTSSKVDGVYVVDRHDGLPRSLDWRIVLELDLASGKSRVHQTRTVIARSERATDDEATPAK